MQTTVHHTPKVLAPARIAQLRQANYLARHPTHAATALVQQWGVTIKAINHDTRTINIDHDRHALRFADSNPFTSLVLWGGARKVCIPYRGCTVQFVQLKGDIAP